jgi:hypothetical protein
MTVSGKSRFYESAEPLEEDALPVDPAIRTTHMGHGIFECGVLIGT